MKEKYWIAFSSIEQLDSNFILRIYKYFNDIEKAYNASYNDLKNIEGLSISKCEKFIEQRSITNIENVFNRVKNDNINFITFDNKDYPTLLKEIPNPPAILYYKGDLLSCNLNKTLAVVGSRKASYHGREDLKSVLSGFINTDICIVSGLASGIDTVAHTSAIENNIKTIGVIASGFDYVYPSANKSLYEMIIDGKGAILTEYYPTFKPTKFRFPQRNRIVSGLSYGTLVTEAGLKSGALITANLALEQGRELMCIPGLISNPNTQGIYKLIKNGATIVTEANDILEALNWEKLFTPDTQLSLLDLSDAENLIIEALTIEEKSIDELILLTKLSFDDLLINLTTLELKGIIKQDEGERYRRV